MFIDDNCVKFVIVEGESRKIDFCPDEDSLPEAGNVPLLDSRFHDAKRDAIDDALSSITDEILRYSSDICYRYLRYRSDICYRYNEMPRDKIKADIQDIKVDFVVGPYEESVQAKCIIVVKLSYKKI